MRKKTKKFLIVALLVVAALFGGVWFYTGEFGSALAITTAIPLMLALPAVILAYFYSNAPRWWRRFRGVSHEAHVAELERAGKAVRENHEGLRAMTFEDRASGSLLHLIDVGGGRVLCLHGQYYFDFEPFDDDPDMNQPRKFPTTRFSLMRDKKNGKVLALIPGETVLQPIIGKPIVDRKPLLKLGVKFEDGAIIPATVLDAAAHLGTK